MMKNQILFLLQICKTVSHLSKKPNYQNKNLKLIKITVKIKSMIRKTHLQTLTLVTKVVLVILQVNHVCPQCRASRQAQKVCLRNQNLISLKMRTLRVTLNTRLLINRLHALSKKREGKIWIMLILNSFSRSSRNVRIFSN